MRTRSTLRGHGRRRQLAVPWLALILVATLVGVAKWPNAWWWVVVVATAAGSLIPAAISASDKMTDRRLRGDHAVRSNVVGTLGSSNPRLPLLRDLGLDELRVHRAVLSIPYVERAVEEEIRDCLLSSRPTLVVGGSMAGKTRVTSKVTCELFGDRPILVPSSRASIAALDAENIQVRDTVIWLDDLDRLLGADGITEGSLRRLLAARNILVGTIRSRAYDNFRPTDSVRPPEWDALSIFRRVILDSKLSAAEDASLTRAVADEAIRNRIRLVGLGEYVAAAEIVSY